MTYQPVGNKVLVKRYELKEKTKSGLFLAPNSQDKIDHAIVVGVGDGVKDIKLEVGDIIVFDIIRGYRINTSAEELILLLEHEILAKVNEDENDRY